MKEKIRRFIAFSVAVFTLITLFPLYSQAGSAITPDDAIAWAEAQVGKSLDYDHVAGAQCVDLIMYYYDFLGVSPVSGDGCDYATNPLPAGWTRVKGGVPQKGDILVYTYITSSAGHVAIYGGGTTMYHGRFVVGHVVKTTDRPYNWTSGYWGYIRPDFSGKFSSGNATGLTFRVNEPTNVRSGASTAYDIVRQAAGGSTVTVTQITSDNWGCITMGSSTSWICLNWSQFVSGTFTTANIANLRSTPSVSGTIVDTIPKDTTLTVTRVNGGNTNPNWGYVTFGGKSGWVCLLHGADKEAEVNWTMVDISQWNAPSALDWAKLKAAGVNAVIIRIGGRYVSSKALYNDDTFFTHYKAAKAAGMHVGTYFFSYALTEAQAREEAQRTIEILNKYNCELDMPVFIDIEDYSESNGTDYQHSGAGKTVCTKVVNTFCDEIEEAGYYPGIYCSKSFAEDLIDTSAFNNRAVWIAHYGVTQCGYTGNYDIWQYTRYGSISGSTGYIDLNHCYTDFPALIEARKTSGFGDHKAGDWKTVTAATCTAAGKKQKNCIDCGIVLETEEIAPAAHNSSEIYIYLLDTSLKAGDTVSQTQKNRFHYKSDKDFESSMYLSAWETQGGTKLTYCTKCGKVLTAEYSYPGCKHESKKDKITDATCSAEGKQETTCTKCSSVVYSALIAPKAHTEGTKTFNRTSCTEAGTYTTACAACKKAYKTTYVVPTQHTPGAWKTESKLTCVTDGKYTAVCTVCKQTLTRTVTHPGFGNVDSTEGIGAGDARLALRAAVGLERLSETAAAAADVDNSGKVDAADARLLLRITVGLEKQEDLLKKYYNK